jgi:tRNA A58 N-methylase Trm61
MRDAQSGLYGWVTSTTPASNKRLLLLPLLDDTEPARAVIFEPTPLPIVRAMLALAQVSPTDVVYDLGSGDGRIPMTAAKEYGACGVGVEIDPTLIAEARANAQQAGLADQVQFIEGNMFEADCSGATVVTLFLHPAPNRQLRPKLLAQLKPGARIVSYIWDMGDWQADAVQRLENQRWLYLWRVPERHATSASTSVPRTRSGTRRSACAPRKKQRS